MPSQVLDYSANTFCFKSVIMFVNGKQYKLHLKSAAYSDSLETKAVTDSQSRLPLGVTVGNYTAKGSIEFATIEAASEFRQNLGANWLEQTLSFAFSYAEPGKKTITDRIAQARILGNDLSASGSDAIPLKHELLILSKIQWGGLDPIS